MDSDQNKQNFQMTVAYGNVVFKKFFLTELLLYNQRTGQKNQQHSGNKLLRPLSFNQQPTTSFSLLNTKMYSLKI
jgi:hypothetical protein